MALTLRLTRLLPSTTESADSVHRAVTARKSAAGPPAGLRATAHVTDTVVGGWPVTRVAPRSNATGAHLVYLHGGAYIQPLMRWHWSIVRALVAGGVTVSMPHYGLAPAHHADEAYAMLDELYDDLASSGHPVAVGGDSAGGGLAVGFALRVRDQRLQGSSRPTPSSLLLIAPWLDVTMSDPAAEALERGDPLLGIAGLREAGLLWAGATDPRDPQISPLFGDLHGLPPIHITQGDRDVLLPDVKTFARRVTDAGGEVELRITKGAFHVFVGAPWTPEARRAFRRMRTALRP